MHDLLHFAIGQMQSRGYAQNRLVNHLRYRQTIVDKLG